MPNHYFLIPISTNVKKNGLHAVKSLGDVYVHYDRDTYTIELIEYLGTNIMPVLLQQDETLDYYYSALENHLDLKRTELAEREENESY